MRRSPYGLPEKPASQDKTVARPRPLGAESGTITLSVVDVPRLPQRGDRRGQPPRLFTESGMKNLPIIERPGSIPPLGHALGGHELGVYRAGRSPASRGGRILVDELPRPMPSQSSMDLRLILKAASRAWRTNVCRSTLHAADRAPRDTRCRFCRLTSRLCHSRRRRGASRFLSERPLSCGTGFPW